MNANSLRRILTALLIASPLIAATAPSSAPVAPTTANYTNEWEKNNPSPVYSPVYSPSYGHYNGYNTYSSYGPGSYSVQSYRYNRQTIYFPPDPVALGQPLNLSVAFARTANARNSVLSLMAPYLAEFFYAPLSSHVHEEEISNKQLTRISEYRQQRQAVLGQLRSKLDELRSADPAKRKAELAQLAVSMDPQILDIEAKSEELRRTMVKGGFFEPSVDWDDTRSWRLGDDSKYESFQDEYLVMRASAYFQIGLSQSQRLLLREVAYDLKRRGQDPTSDLGLDSAGSYFSFSPFTSRFRLPRQMPEELRAKVALYRERKEAIKQDLRQTIYRNDRAFLNSTRARAIAEFNTRQTSEIAALELIAEEIREGLVGLKLADEPAQTAITKSLGERLAKYLDEKVEFQRVIMAKLAELKAQLPLDRVEVARTDFGVSIVIEPRRGGNSALREKREAALRELQGFNAALTKSFQHLDSIRAQVRAEIEAFASQSTNLKERSMDQLIAECSRAVSVQENWNRYSEYRTAVLEPGLSPAQRRLLYAGSLETLMMDFIR